MAKISQGSDKFFRLSPADRSKALCFGVTRGEIVGRVDVNFWRLTPLFLERFSKPCFPAVELGKLVHVVQYGSSALASVEPIGVPMLD